MAIHGNCELYHSMRALATFHHLPAHTSNLLRAFLGPRTELVSTGAIHAAVCRALLPEKSL